MTGRTGKFGYDEWLLFTQFVEILEAPPGSRGRADELVDLVHVAVDAVCRMGFDPAEVFEARWGKGGKGADVVNISRRYRKEWQRIERRWLKGVED